jgi:DNA-binding transcriptional LysR family regulator
MKVSDFNLRHLRALAAAVRSGSIGGAATAVGISQPAVTQAIARLEATTGARLFERTPTGVVPTDAAILLGARGDGAAQIIAGGFGPARKGGIAAAPGAAEAVTMAQMTALLALADGGSYAAAAAASGLSQPSLHRAVKDLERLCAVPLARRSGRGVVVTEAGQSLARAFRLAFAELQAALDELAILAGRDQGRIRIGVDPSLVDRMIGPAVANFLKEHPPVTIEVVAMGRADGLESVREGRLDGLVTIGPESAPGLTVEALGNDPLSIVARAGHKLAGAAAPGLARLASFGWAVGPEGSDDRSAWERMFLDGGLYPPAPSVTCPSLPALIQLAAASDLLTIAPAALIGKAGAIAAVGSPLQPARQIVLATRAGWAPSPAQATFLDELRGGAARTRF